MNKEKKALLCNATMVILELIGFGLYIRNNRFIPIEYYTIDSNLLLLLSSIIFILFFKTKRKEIQDLRFMATCSLAVTILVVTFILIPMANFNFKALMLENEFLIFHCLCPIISTISYVFYEKRSTKEYLGLLFTAVYSIVLITLNLTSVVVGPYPFLKIKGENLCMCFMLGVPIVIGSYFIGKTLNYFNKKKEA